MTEGEIIGAMQRLGISRDEAMTHDYLGDGVYATFDGYQIWLRTLEGHRIALDRHVQQNFINYREQLKEATA